MCVSISITQLVQNILPSDKYLERIDLHNALTHVEDRVQYPLFKYDFNKELMCF
jgi:hypothetical protein